MSLGLLGTKIGMTQVFDKKGNIISVTVIKTSPCFITQIKSKTNEGYNAIQVGYMEMLKKETKLTKPEVGHLTKNNLSLFKHLKEFRLNNISSFIIGQELNLNLFQIGELITISGLTIGKGNTGNIKLHNFNRGAMSHGSKHHRLQGSMGAGTSPGRVFPGKRMPRRSGMELRTIKNLKIVDILLNENLLIIKGSIPGKFGNLITIKQNNK